MVREIDWKMVKSRIIYTAKNGVVATSRSMIPIILAVLIPSLVARGVSEAGVQVTLSNLLGLDSVLEPVVNQSVSLFASLLVIVAYLYITDEDNLVHRFNAKYRHILWIVGGLAGLLVANAIISAIISEFGVTVGENIGVGTDVDPRRYLYLIPVMIFLVGPLEELMFRGILQGSFRQEFTIPTSIAFTSIVFGLFHISSIAGSGIQIVAYIIITIALGAILGYVYEKTRSIAVAILVHGLYNSVLLLATYADSTFVNLFF